MPNLRYIAEAQMAAHRMFTMIDRVPDIDSENAAGQTLKVKGALELRNVQFRYPSRPKQNVLEDFNLVIPAGQISLPKLVKPCLSMGPLAVA